MQLTVSRQISLLVVVALVAVSLSVAVERQMPSSSVSQIDEPPDISGLAWLDGNIFLTVHDAKMPEELSQPRVGVLELPDSLGEVRWQALEVSWPRGEEPSHDLESIARIPGTSTFLLVESGDDGTGTQRIHVAEVAGSEVRIQESVSWPVPITNVEGSAVAQVGSDLIFLFAERAHGSNRTRVVWTPLSLNPVMFGEFRSTEFHNPDPTGPHARPASAIEIDSRGRLYLASTFDRGNDAGPFRSTVWEAGWLEIDSLGETYVVLRDDPKLIATLDGLKVEGVAARDDASGSVELFVGTDDENYGGIIRPLPERMTVPPTE